MHVYMRMEGTQQWLSKIFIHETCYICGSPSPSEKVTIASSSRIIKYSRYKQQSLVIKYNVRYVRR